MNTFQKKLMLITIVIATSLFTYAFSVTENSPGILTVRTTEAVSGMVDNSMTTVYPDGTQEKVDLEKLKVNNLSGNLKMINQHLNSLVIKGYKLNSVAGGSGDGIIVTTYTFLKE